jgi:hypothetical protein
VISPELSRAVVALQFSGVRDDMEGCLSFFAATYPDQSSIAAANERHGLYDQQASGATAATWGDLLDSKKSRSLQLPVDYFQLELVLFAYHRWIQILLGEQHPVAMGIRSLVMAMGKLKAADLYEALKGPQRCAELMAAIDVYTWSWADEQECSDAPVLPQYERLAQQLRLRDWKPPVLSAKLLAVVKPPPSGPAGGNRRAAAPVAAAAAAVVNKDHEPGVYDGNMAVNKLLQKAYPPKLPCGQMPCLFYHVGARCTRSPCPYSVNHRKLKAPEVAILAAYVAEYGPAAKA